MIIHFSAPTGDLSTITPRVSGKWPVPDKSCVMLPCGVRWCGWMHCAIFCLVGSGSVAGCVVQHRVWQCGLDALSNTASRGCYSHTMFPHGVLVIQFSLLLVLSCPFHNLITSISIRSYPAVSNGRQNDHTHHQPPSHWRIKAPLFPATMLPLLQTPSPYESHQ